MGASDYIVKPFTPTELSARIRSALIRRMAPEQAEPAEPSVSGELTINYRIGKSPSAARRST